MEYELHPERHSSVERDQWVNTIVIEYKSKQNEGYSFEVFGSNNVDDICFWIEELELRLDASKDLGLIPVGNYTIRVDYEHDVPLARAECLENGDLTERILKNVYFELEGKKTPLEIIHARQEKRALELESQIKDQ